MTEGEEGEEEGEEEEGEEEGEGEDCGFELWACFDPNPGVDLELDDDPAWGSGSIRGEGRG